MSFRFFNSRKFFVWFTSFFVFVALVLFVPRLDILELAYAISIISGIYHGANVLQKFSQTNSLRK